MKIKSFIDRDFNRAKPYDSIARIENDLLQYGFLAIIGDTDEFFGLLTTEDVLKAQHNLAIDCLTDFSKMNENEELSEALALMHNRSLKFLAIFSNDRKFIGVINSIKVIEEINRIQNSKNEIVFNNIIGPRDVEQSKQLFMHQMFHNVKNPLQVILSSVYLLADIKEKRDKEILISSIKSNIDKVDNLIDTLYSEYHVGSMQAENDN